jgi:hypothetical protein
MERRYAWLQEMVKRKKIKLTFIPTTKQPADYLTKALHSPAFERCFKDVGQVRGIQGDGDDVAQFTATFDVFDVEDEWAAE